jgi:NTP pyrophosphatase (non-canonical NTP hydrolase)
MTVDEVTLELDRARAKFPAFHSAHEGFAVLMEEVDELWDEVRANGSRERMRAEAIQVAAMALRFISDVCEGT